MTTKKDFGNFLEIKDLLNSYIKKVPDNKYELIYGAKLAGANLENEDKDDENVHKFLILCGKSLAPTQYEFFIVEYLLDFGYETTKLIREFDFKNLTQVGVQDYQEAFLQLVFDTKPYDFFFEKKKPRDAMLWSILTLFYKVRGKYPILGKVDLTELDKLAEKNKFNTFHSVFNAELELNPDVAPRTESFSPVKENAEDDSENEDNRRDAISSVVDPTSERLGMLNTLANSKNLKADYKLVEKKLFNERQGILQGIVQKLQEKDEDASKLQTQITKIDEHLTKMQQTFEKHKAKVTKLRAIISSVEKMNSRIYQEQKNKKMLSIYLHKLITKFEITPQMEDLLLQPGMDASCIPDICEILAKLNQIIHDDENYGETMAVELSKERARKLFSDFIIQFTANTAAILQHVLSNSKFKQTLPSIFITFHYKIANNAVMGYFDERKELLKIVHTHSSESQWKEFVHTLSSGLHEEIAEYCKFRKTTLENSFEKILLPMASIQDFSFLELPANCLEDSRNQKPDVVIAWQFLVHMNELEGNEEYWRKILDPTDTGKTAEMGINQLFSVIYSDLQDNIIHIIEGVSRRNPTLLAPFYMACLQLSDTYKLGSIPYKLFEEISNSVQNFETKYDFKSEALKKIVYAVEETCGDIFGDFLVFLLFLHSILECTINET